MIANNKLKYVILFITFLCFSNDCLSGRFDLHGQILNAPDSYYVKVVYDIVSDGKWRRVSHDSILVENGEFFLSGQIEELSPAYIEINKQRLRFYLEPSKITLQMDAQAPYKMQLMGTTVDNEFRTYMSDFQECDSILVEKFKCAVNWEYTSEYTPDDPGLYSLFAHEKEKKLLVFCKRHIGYKIVPDILLQALEIDMDSWNQYYDGEKNVHASKRDVYSGINKINKVIKKLTTESLDTNIGKKLLKMTNHAKTVFNCRKKPIGSEAPTFVAVTSFGDSIDISNYRNKKYVLLYFWADKVQETPNAKKVVKKMTERIANEDIVRISISSYLDGEEWRKEISTNESEYLHVKQSMSSDLYQLFVKQIDSLYPFGMLPTYILIDKKGKIESIAEGVLQGSNKYQLGNQ